MSLPPYHVSPLHVSRFHFPIAPLHGILCYAFAFEERFYASRPRFCHCSDACCRTGFNRAGRAAPAEPPTSPSSKLTGKWLVNFDAATLQARKEKKLILAYFSGSDWEPYTQKLEKDVLNTDMFRDWVRPARDPLPGRLHARQEGLA